ncbi:hepatitis A virus cellular receptor 1-like isoform X1 [Periplaneta americana]|uniref:hepatitis A virus cellular receptor 1-like isoform X1 n=1 Tax=Periplaneta americana TaxID=6978 RepID=UPI0037E77316
MEVKLCLLVAVLLQVTTPSTLTGSRNESKDQRRVSFQIKTQPQQKNAIEYHKSTLNENNTDNKEHLYQTINYNLLKNSIRGQWNAIKTGTERTTPNYNGNINLNWKFLINESIENNIIYDTSSDTEKYNHHYYAATSQKTESSQPDTIMSDTASSLIIPSTVDSDIQEIETSFTASNIDRDASKFSSSTTTITPCSVYPPPNNSTTDSTPTLSVTTEFIPLRDNIRLIPVSIQPTENAIPGETTATWSTAYATVTPHKADANLYKTTITTEYIRDILTDPTPIVADTPTTADTTTDDSTITTETTTTTTTTGTTTATTSTDTTTADSTTATTSADTTTATTTDTTTAITTADTTTATTTADTTTATTSTDTTTATTTAHTTTATTSTDTTTADFTTATTTTATTTADTTTATTTTDTTTTITANTTTTGTTTTWLDSTSTTTPMTNSSPNTTTENSTTSTITTPHTTYPNNSTTTLPITDSPGNDTTVDNSTNDTTDTSESTTENTTTDLPTTTSNNPTTGTTITDSSELFSSETMYIVIAVAILALFIIVAIITYTIRWKRKRRNAQVDRKEEDITIVVTPKVNGIKEAKINTPPQLDSLNEDPVLQLVSEEDSKTITNSVTSGYDSCRSEEEVKYYCSIKDKETMSDDDSLYSRMSDYYTMEEEK